MVLECTKKDAFLGYKVNRRKFLAKSELRESFLEERNKEDLVILKLNAKEELHPNQALPQ